MTSASPQRLRIIPGDFVVEHMAGGVQVPDGEWLALARAPEGLTIVRPARPEDDQGAERWSAFYGGDTAHGLDAPGMLAACSPRWPRMGSPSSSPPPSTPI